MPSVIGSEARKGSSPRQRYKEAATSRGFALALALLAVVLIAALLAALFFAVNEETRTGVAIAARDDALSAAESAIEAGLDRLSGMQGDEPAVGRVEMHSVAAGVLPSIVYITRLDSTLYWLVAVVGREGEPGPGVRRIGVLASAKELPEDSIRIVRVTRRGWSELF